MAFFKFRKGGDDQSAPAAQPESVEVLRRRAKNRLIGSAILVLIGVFGFPLLVDKEPRPVAVNLPIEIPDRKKVMPLGAPAAPAPATPAAVATEAATAPSAPQSSGSITEAAPVAAETPAAKTPSKPAKAEAKPAQEGRFVVQVGSFADESRAREVRLKLERAGLKNYTQSVETKDGRRIRVRAGPFASKAEVDRAVEKIRKHDPPVSVLSL